MSFKERLSKLWAVPLLALAMSGMATTAGATNQALAPSDNVITGSLFGNVISAAAWGNEANYGLYNIGADGKIATEAIYKDLSMTGSAGVYVHGNYYVVQSMAYGTFVMGVTVYGYDVEKQQQLFATNLQAVGNNVALSFAYDRIDDVVYAITRQTNVNGFLLSKFDYDKLTFTPICRLQMQYMAMAIDDNHNIYVIDNAGTVHLLNKTDGTTTEIVKTFHTTSYTGSAVWSPKDQRIIWAVTDNQKKSYLVSIDPQAKDFTDVEADNAQIIGLTARDMAGATGAPKAVTDLKIEYTTPGSMTGNIVCTAPSQSVDDKALSGDLTAVIAVDGVAQDPQTVAAGAKLSVPVTFTESGYHRVTVSFSVNALQSEAAVAYTFAGFDTPSQVKNLEYTLSETGALKLTWEAPEGVNGELLGELSYEVMRNGEKIASPISTSFDEKIGGDLQVYQYSVIAVAGDKRSEAASTAKFAFGDPAPLPYTQNLETEDDFVYMTVIDHNADGATWQYDSNYKIAKYQQGSPAVDADDYLLLPRMNLTEGNIYKVDFDLYSDRTNSPEKLSLVLLKYEDRNDPTKAETLGEVAEIKGTSWEKQHAEFSFSAKADGIYYIGVHCTSPKEAWNICVTNFSVVNNGKEGSPKIISDLEVSPDTEGALKATLTFTAPSTNYLDEPITSIDKIEILRNGKLVHTLDNVAPKNIITWTDETVEKADFYTYSVRSVNEHGAGMEATAETYIGSFGVPLTLSLETAEDFEKMATADLDGGGNTFMYDSEKKMAYYRIGEQETPRDYLFTPMMKLNAEKTYRITFEGVTLMDNADQIVFLDLSKDMEGSMVSRIYPAHVFRKGGEFQPFESVFSVPETGFYCIGFSYDKVGTYAGEGIGIRNIKIEEGIDPAAPDAVIDLTGYGAAEGKLEAHLEFTMPSKAFNGDDLTTKMGVDVYNRNNDLVLSTEKIYDAGQKVELDVKALQGINKFTVVATNEKGQGYKNDRAMFCGEDIPLRVSNLTIWAATDNMSSTLKWEVPEKGVYNGWFDKSTLVYNVKRVNAETGEVTDLAQTDKLSYVVKADENDKAQKIYYYAVTPETRAGEYDETVPYRVVMGEPMKLPFFETNAEGITKTSPWMQQEYIAYTRWAVGSEIEDFDAKATDGGFFYSLNDLHHAGTVELFFPKLDLRGTKKPTLSFKVYSYFNAHAIARIKISTDGVNYNQMTVASADNISETGKNGWVSYDFDLSAYKNKPWISISLESTIDQYEYMIIDDILVADKSGIDMRVDYFEPSEATVKPGEELTLTTTVSNNGDTPSRYKVEYLREDEVIATNYGAEVAAGKTAHDAFTYIATAADAGSEVKFSARVVADDDANQYNDEMAAFVNFNDAALPGVTDLTAESDGADAVKLDWSKPQSDIVAEPVTDSFEDYESFVIDDFGPYKMHDADKQGTLAMATIQYPNQYQRQAFTVFNPMAGGIRYKDNPEWAPRTGSKMLVSWTSAGKGAGTVQENDDWFISPKIKGGTELSLYAKVIAVTYTDHIQFMYSTTTDNIEDFKALGEEVLVTELDWTEIKTQLPDDAKYFAIRHYKTGEGVALLIDDLTYTPSDEVPEVQGYQIERNGTIITENPIAAEAYNDPVNHNGDYLYYVTAVYAEGKSAPSNVAYVSVTTSSLENVIANGYMIYGKTNAIVVKGAEGLEVSVYGVDGKLVTAAAVDTDEKVFPVNTGIYIVHINGKAAQKVIVK